MSWLLKIKLLLSLGLFFVQLTLEHLKEVRVLLFSTLLLTTLLCLVAINLLTRQAQPPGFPLKNVAIVNTAAQTTQNQYSLEEYHTKLTQYLTLLAVQPTHRDLLLNLALFYQAQDNPAKAQELWLAAQQLDPNHPVFSIQK